MSLETRLQGLVGAIGGDIKALFVRSVPEGGTTGQVLVKTGSGLEDKAWANPTAGTQITVSSTPPTNPQTNDLWLDIS